MSNVSVPQELWDIFMEDWFPVIQRARYRGDFGMSIRARERLTPGIEMVLALKTQQRKELPAGVRPR